ncbi:MAG: M23 family metallopeptidase, partial [Bacteroidota bacterium]
MRILFFIALLIVGTAFSGIEEEKKKYPKDYFRSPVNRNIQLAGTFGELRPNHFHAGIDIKGKVGETIYAVAEGYVARIKIQSGGYGKVLYIKHPNGYTSVYAHLQKMTKELEAYVKQFQYKRESFEVELFPSPGQFAFAKGEPIAKMGVSGRSYGPHLHFEIRDTETEKPINPLLFGLKVADNVPPKLHQLKAYFLNDRRETLHSQTFKLIKTRQGYRIKGDTLELGAWRTGFGLKVYDHMTGVSNWNGIYSLQMFQDSVEVYSFEMETFAFSESRYINAHLDYEEQVSKKSYFNRCYRLPGNRLTIYPERIDGGVIQLHQNKSSEIRLLAKDLAGNSAELRFWVKRSEVKAPREKLFTYFLPYNEENLIENPSL